MAEAISRAARFQQLLHDYNELPDERERILVTIQEGYCTTLGILVIDTCGSSRTTHALGILPFLARQELLWRLVEPVVEHHGGRMLCTEADNFYAVFPDAPAAVRCTAEILSHLDAANEALPAAEEVEVSIGIGYGSVLDVGDGHLYGDEMNLAFKLGEDLAGPREVLITPAARATLDNAWRLESVAFDVAGMHLDAYRLLT
ncbi:MAG TPA: adenylate/guanylate cyclase domain-containing protein [Chloroflexota bacterium]|jgi:class 3 adenylate cyclase